MKKNCPCCGNEFECLPERIGECQCSTIQLNEEERSFLAARFDACLCVTCLKKMKVEVKNHVE